jgi:hypothetical protein
MKTKFVLPIMLWIFFIAVFVCSCKKDLSLENAGSVSSLKAFLNSNAAPLQTFTVNCTTGGSFTTSQGTVVNIPANDFKLPSGRFATGNITIQFRDLYKKSDMLFADVSTDLEGKPLKSAGEFFICAKQGDSALQIANRIDVQQPANGQPVDTMMQAFVANTNLADTGNVDPVQWIPNNDSVQNNNVVDTTTADTTGNNNNDTLNQSPVPCQEFYTADNYVFSLYNFSAPAVNGTWCNSDNGSYFYNYPNTSLTLQCTSTLSVNTYREMYIDVFLVFKNINCMVHVYSDYNTGVAGSQNTFTYANAPQGLQATVVAVYEDPAGQLKASFTPITIGDNQTVNFALSPITQDDFAAQVRALD